MKKTTIILVAILAIGFSLHYLRIDQKQEDAAVRDELPAKSMQVDLNYGRIPMHFEPNQGQIADPTPFLARGPGYLLLLKPTEAELRLRSVKPDTGETEGAHKSETNISEPAKLSKGSQSTLRIRLTGANSHPKVEPLTELPGKSNYFLGNDPAKWRTNVPNYEKIIAHEVYPGIDLVYYGNQRQLEYDFILKPGADPDQITMAFEGAQDMNLDADGNLGLAVDGGAVILRAPMIYQEVNGSKMPIAGQFVQRGPNQVGFEVEAYDPARPLVIDPELVYSTYLGGSSADQGISRVGMAVDTAGNAYVVGTTESTDFPTANPFQPTFGGSLLDAFVTKLNSDGSGLVYSTYLGGSDWDFGHSIAVDTSGNAYVAGSTGSPDFPTVNSLKDTVGGNVDAFVAKLNPTGSALIYSTYLGGYRADGGHSIAVDLGGNAYVTGETHGSSFAPYNDFPTVNPLQSTPGGSVDAFVAKFDPVGSPVYSTYLGGRYGDTGYGIAVDASGNAYVIGHTSSDNFPTANALQPFYGGVLDVFVAKLNPSGSALVYSTYLGGSGRDYGYAIAADDLGNAYLTGETLSDDFPKANALHSTRSNQFSDGFVTKLDPNGAVLVYSTYLNYTLKGNGIAVDASGNAYVVAYTSSELFFTVDPIQETPAGLWDAVVAMFNPTGSEILFSTYLGGSGHDQGHGIAILSTASGVDIYVAGETNSTDFPVINPIQEENAGREDAFVAKIGRDKDKLEILRIRPDPLSPQWFWVERTLRPGEKWTFSTIFRYTLTSADSGVVRMEVKTKRGFFLGENTVEVKRAKDALKLNFESPEVTIPDVPVDEVDTLYVKLKLFPANKPDATASDSVFYRIFIHKWTFMVYLDGDNDLEPESLIDFSEMTEVTSNDSLAIVIQWDRLLIGRGDASRIFNHRDYYREKSMGELNMGDPATLRNFVQWALRKFPAQRYALVLWDHGGGWRAPQPAPPVLRKITTVPEFPKLPPGGGSRSRGNYKDVAVDETDNDVLFSSEIRQALSELPKLDILAFDACLMGMVENAYQYRHGADYMVGSEALVPGDGWPYHTILERLKQRPEFTAIGLSHVIVKEYGFSYPSDELDITQSAVNLWEMEQVREALDALAGLLISKRPWYAVESALEQVRYFWPEPNRDLYHFAQLLKTTSNDQSIQLACDDLLKALDKAVFANYHSSAEENANGLAIFFPTVMAQYDASYDWVNNIQLSDDTQWDEFLRLFLSRGAPIVDTYEPNDWLTQAYGPLFPETAYYSHFPHPGDRDFYFITTGQESHLSVMLTSPAGVNWDVAVFDFDGAFMGRSLSTTAFDTLSFTNLPRGSYYIEVISNGISVAEVPYKLEVDYQGSRSGQVRLSADDGVPDSSLFSTNAGDIIGMRFHAPTYPMRLDEISFYIESIDGAGTGGDGSFYVWLADYFGTIIEPFPVTPVSGSLQKSFQSPGWFSVALVDSAIMLQSDFVVGIGYDGQNTPTLGIDSVDNGHTFQWDSATRNWRALEASAFIRATVSYLETPDRVRLSLPAELHAEPDATVSVPVEISKVPVAGVDSLDLEIYYEPSALRFEALGRENTLTSDWQVDSLEVVPAGQIGIQMTGGSKITAGGLLLNLRFYVQPEAALGDTVELFFNHVRLNGGAYFVETKSGNIIVTTPTSVREPGAQPEEFALWQNYPNPFNPETTIRYDLAKPSEVRIEIFNLLGQKIRTLMDAPKPAGSYTVVWNGRDQLGRQVSSGVYLMRMQASQESGGEFVKVRKMALIK